MIHLFKKNDWFFAIDVNSGAVHAVDEIVYDLLGDYQELSSEQLLEKYQAKHQKPRVEEALEEIKELIDKNQLFSEDNYITSVKFLNRAPVVKALCLHVAHDCNIRCKYCFAAQGDFECGRLLMPIEVGKKALDFVVANSGKRRQLEVDLFGGEPLMNWEVCKELVEYGKKIGEENGKILRFTVTTNGTLLNDEKIEFINENFHNVVLSIDGRKTINDEMRPTPAGGGTYDMIVPKFKQLAKGRNGKSYYVRGTFTSQNLDFDKDVIHLADLGFSETSVEPVVSEPGDFFSIKESDLPEIFDSYDRLAEEMVSRINRNDEFNFFHYTIDLERGPCLIKRVSGCGAGTEYLSITPEGDIYPCHQFVGKDEFKMGNIMEDNFADLEDFDFRSAHVGTKEDCQECWAKYYCSGGCHANAYNFNGTINKPYKIGCQMERKRIENAIYIKAEEMSRA